MSEHMPLPEKLEEYQSLQAMVAENGSRRIYGIDAEGKKHQVKADDVLDAYGYDPTMSPESFDRIENESPVEEIMIPVEMEAKQLDHSIEAEIGFDQEQVDKLPRREKRAAEKVLKALKGVEVELAKEDAASWNTRVKSYSARQDVLDKMEKEGPDYTPSKDEIEILKNGDHQEELDAKAGKDSITEDDIAYYRSLKKNSDEKVANTDNQEPKKNVNGTLPPPPPPTPKKNDKGTPAPAKADVFKAPPKAGDLEVGSFLDKDGKPITDLDDLGRLVAEKVANGDDSDFEKLIAVLREAARFDSLNRGRNAAEFEKLFDKFADSKRAELAENKKGKQPAAGAAVASATAGANVTPPVVDVNPGKNEKKRIWTKVAAGFLGAAMLVGLGYGGKQVYDNITEDDGPAVEVDEGNGDEGALGNALTGNGSEGSEGSGAGNESPSAEDITALEQATSDRVGVISDVEGAYPWTRAEKLYGDQATPRLMQAVDALNEMNPDANAHWVGDPMTSKDAYIVVNNNTDTDYVWNQLAQAMGPQDVANFLNAQK